MGTRSQDTVDSLFSHLSIDTGGRSSIGKHLVQITELLKDMDDELHATKKIAVLTILTGCELTDGSTVDLLKVLEGLPLKIIIRICCEESQTADHWHSVSAQLDLDIDIIGHVKTEAMVMIENNNWLTYGEPLHCLREFGIAVPVINDISMRQLSMHELWTLARIL